MTKTKINSCFDIWCLTLLLFFVISNIAGLIRFSGLKHFRFIGFPFIFAAWGVGIESFFDWRILAINSGIAIVASVISALLLSRLR